MSQAAWFWQKADECARQAKNASEPDRRGDYETQAEQWRQMDLADQPFPLIGIPIENKAHLRRPSE